MATLVDLLSKPEQRPEPEVVREFSEDEIVEAALRNPGALGVISRRAVENKMGEILDSVTYNTEVPNLLPYVEALVVEILRHYSGSKILLAARDAETFYDALRVVLEVMNGGKMCICFLAPLI